MLMEQGAYQAEMAIDVSSVLAITWLNPGYRCRCEVKLARQRGMNDQHVPNVDKLGLMTSGALLSPGGTAAGAPSGVGVAVSAVRGSAVGLGHGSSLSSPNAL
jgi:hypothetical protein